MSDRNRWNLFKHIMPGIVAALVALFLYLPSLGHGFVNWDDNNYVYANPRIRLLNLDFFKWVFTSDFYGNWHPLTIITYALEYRFWGIKPFGYILVNLILHSLNTFLVFILTIRVLQIDRGGRYPSNDPETPSMLIWAGFVTALLFGVHPIHVESVVWVSETKDVLCAFFFLLTVFSYLAYASSGNGRERRFYYLALVFAALALLSKPMAITLPFVLLILDFYPCDRVKGFGQGLKKALLEKIPFLSLTILSIVFTLYAQSKAGAIHNYAGIVSRLGVAIRGYAFYIYKLVLPFGLSPVYPYPASKAEIFNAGFAAAVILLAVLFVGCVMTFKKYAGVTAAFAYYVVTLSPVSGIMQVGGQAAADRYAYLPTVGFFIIAGYLAARVFEKGMEMIKIVVVIAGIVVVAGLSMLTFWQQEMWQNSLTLWSQQILRYPGRVAFAYLNRAVVFTATGDMESALRDVNTAIEIDPTEAKAYNNRADILYNTGRKKEALIDMDRAIEINPKYAEAYLHRAMMRVELKDFGAARSDFDAAVNLAPADAMPYFQRANFFLKQNDIQSALKDYNDALRLTPDLIQAYLNRADVYSRLGEPDKALNDVRTALRFNHNDPAEFEDIGSAFKRLGNDGEASATFEKAAKLRRKTAKKAFLY